MQMTLEVCLIPSLFSRRQSREDLIIVVADILRATSAMCVALAEGAAALHPVASLAQARRMKSEGFFVVAERGGMKPSFADAGNSPAELASAALDGKAIAYTTTNGTRVIRMAEGHGLVVIGSFLNLSALSEWLSRQEKNILILCAGWEGSLSLEDSLFAGALSQNLLARNLFIPIGDEVVTSLSLFCEAEGGTGKFASRGSHFKRLEALGFRQDLELCFSEDLYKVIPLLDRGVIRCLD